MKITEHWQYVRQGDEHLPMPPHDRRELALLALLLGAIALLLGWDA